MKGEWEEPEGLKAEQMRTVFESKGRRREGGKERKRVRERERKRGKRREEK